MWKEENNFLVRDFKFGDFQEAFAFLTRVAFLAEKQGHHPTIENTYNSVILKLNTHDEGNVVTQKDHDLASAIDKIN